jgi:squalene-hopene/tetraprenyl-beta-curcumene cyclase
MRLATRGLWVFPTCVVSLFAASFSHNTKSAYSWDPKAAAAYLDQRAGWWIAWPAAARDNGTFCVSCHTVVPYALARPTLRVLLGQESPGSVEKALLNNVIKRVRLSKDLKPFYDEREGVNKTAESRGTEAVLNALILANYDTYNGKMSPDTRAAFDNMWGLQRRTGDMRGSWSWLQFNNEPWEGHDSAYYGAALAAVAVGIAPENYRSTLEIQNNLVPLRDYLNREFVSQSPINQVILLWASVKWPGLLASEQQAAILKDILSKQREDGSWSLASLAWTWRDWNLRSLVKMWFRSDGTPLEPKADGYATGLIAFVLEQAGLRSENEHLKKSLQWLVSNQNKTTGLWRGYSLNRRTDPYQTGLFMSDAATAYAVLALTGAN